MKKFVCISVQLLFGVVISLSAQPNDVLETLYSEYGTPALIQFNTKVAKHPSSEGNGIIKLYLKLDDYNEYRSIKSSTDNFGNYHERFQHFYKGIKVEFSEYVVHSDKEKTITSISGWFGPLLIGLFYRRLNIHKKFNLFLS